MEGNLTLSNEYSRYTFMAWSDVLVLGYRTVPSTVLYLDTTKVFSSLYLRFNFIKNLRLPYCPFMLNF
jgi:hypothetical protein